jgi:putative Holliday junction resolvase
VDRPHRIAAIDFGSVRLGIAVADEKLRIALPLENYTRRGPVADAEHLRRLAQEERIDRFVVGLPVHLDGRESQQSAQARVFAAWLERATGVPVSLFDERFSSHEAEQRLGEAGLTSKQRRARRDMLAAQILLTAYLEAPPGADHEPRPLDG